MRASEFPYLRLQSTAEKNGVVLKENGDGAPFVFIPGMTGGGQATLHLAVRAILQARGQGRAQRLLLVDYTRERHTTLEGLQETVADLVAQGVGSSPCLVWTESLGNLVAPPGPLDRAVKVQQRVMLSPFTAIPAWRVALGIVSLVLTPASLFRWASRPFGRFLFGPAGDRPDHVFFGALAETLPGDARRRTGWLWRREFTSWFARSAVPTKVWLGALDRLVARGTEKQRFSDLARRLSGFAVEILAGAGHVVTDTALTERIYAEIESFVSTWGEKQ